MIEILISLLKPNNHKIKINLNKKTKKHFIYITYTTPIKL